MRDTKTVRGILLFAGLWALAALGLRIVTITGIMDEYGLIPMRSPILPATVLFCLLGGAILLILCLRLNRLPGTEGCFAGPVGWQAGELLAAAGLLLGSVLRLAHAGEMEYARRVLEYFGPVAAVLMAATSLLRNRMDKLVFWLRLLCAIWFCAGMILRFRSWSQDPLIIHLTPTLLSFLCSLLSLMLLSGFPLGAGHRRSTVLFGQIGRAHV